MGLIQVVRDELPSYWNLTILSTLAIAIAGIYVSSLAVYRLYFSPIANIPGPKLAAVTQWFETYYELVSGGGGNFTREIKKMHEKYGPIVRINPTEVHIDDVEYYETLYAPSMPYSKLQMFENRFNMPRATFATASHDLHKPRRAALAPFFSTRRIQGHGRLMQELVDRICGRLTEEYQGKGKALILNDVYGCLSGDVITNLAFARSYDLLSTEHWESPFTIAVNNLIRDSHTMTHFSWIIPFMNLFPDKLIMAISDNARPIVQFRQEMEQQIRDILAGKNEDAKLASYDTVFAELLNSKLPPHELTQDRLQNEAVSVIGAGFETTRWALTVASYHILANPAITERLRQELIEAIPDPDNILSWADLQALPYLTACIEEALRLSYGIVQRSPRVSPEIGFQYKDIHIPPGFPVSMDNWHMHHNETVFPDSYTYKPERWLGNPKGPDGVKNLSRYMVAFGRGNRMCLGMPMAYCEIYIALASLFRRFEFQLFETGRDNVDFAQDYVTPQPKKGSLGVRVLVK
ncbi:uncharacterized protein BP5553_02214 [Venustampulla echinocandica]|uniref:Cytochrome P450 n=1 Tax=Venustampulla echinocandica TaxID=2656787 RepID=A0A370U393_9HELO|nr:uncharacterized protein BP5553_02214 [Venustampulla echinocandica]RDL42235.1 hypothetical protein BP5553_02214 [Venustampulla echinocandica]